MKNTSSKIGTFQLFTNDSLFSFSKAKLALAENKDKILTPFPLRANHGSITINKFYILLFALKGVENFLMHFQYKKSSNVPYEKFRELFEKGGWGS